MSKKNERKKYNGKWKWIDDTKKCVACLKMALYNSADNNGKKMAIMKMTIVN